MTCRRDFARILSYLPARPPRFRPLADVGLLVKVFGCTASTANV